MKLRKIISLAVTTAIVMMNAVIISMPTVSAETEPEVTNTSTEFYENFEGYDELNQATTLLTLDDNGWYACDHTQLFTTVATDVTPYKEMQGKLANITTIDGSKVLRIVTAGQRTDGKSVQYGYGRALPGVATNGAATGVYSIEFDFKPIATSSQYQFYFGLNTADGSTSDNTIAQHNLVSAYGTNFYTGYRDYMTLFSNSVTQGTISGSAIWYTLKAKVDCDARYYSVEIYNKASGKIVARRSPISFDASETVGFIKFSALGFGNKAYGFYLDNLHILANQAKETTIYNETFGSFSNSSYSAATGITTGGAEVYTGSSYFEGYTPWRFHSDIGKDYAIGNDSTLNSKVVRLGDDTGTAETVEESGLIYMPAGETMVNTTTQSQRGLLKLTFKIKPTKVTDDITVNVIPTTSYDITDANYAFFKIVKDGGTVKLDKGNDEKVAISSVWHQVTMEFDVANRAVKTTVIDESNRKITFSKVGNTTPNAVKAIMFNVSGGSSALVDDIKIEYSRPNPSVKTADLILKDKSGNKVEDNNNATAAIGTIDIPLNTIVKSSTATGITLKDSSLNNVSFTGEVASSPTYNFGDVYRLTIPGTLEQGETYTITVPATVASVYGGTLGSAKTITFTTEAAGPEEIDEETILDAEVDKAGETVVLTANGILNIGEGLFFRNGYVNASNGGYVQTGDRKITGENLYFTNEGKIRVGDGYNAKISRDNGDGTTTQGFMVGVYAPSGIESVTLVADGTANDVNYTGKTLTKEFDFTGSEIYGLANFGFEITNIPKPLEFYVHQD